MRNNNDDAHRTIDILQVLRIVFSNLRPLTTDPHGRDGRIPLASAVKERAMQSDNIIR